MDLLKAEIARKRKATAALIEDVNPEGKIGSTRFVRQSDVMEQRARESAEAQAEVDRKRARLGDEAGGPGEEEAAARGAGASASRTDYSTLTEREVKNRLRNGGHPVTLFGEGAPDRIARLRLIESSAVEEDDFMLTAGHTNVAKGGQAASAGAVGRADDEDGGDEDDEEEEEGRKAATSKVCVFEKTQFAADSKLPKRKVIYKYFRFLLKCWEYDLSQRPDTDKNTAKGKMETRTQKQCKDYIRYLFRLCKKDEVPFDIEHKLHLLVGYCEQGDFRAAHDEYLQAAIGKAAWPIGLTMVGIHERSGREKISTSKVAHVMNNEAQRKYFTSVKRLMTYAQKKRTDIAPSMKVL